MKGKEKERETRKRGGEIERRGKRERGEREIFFY